MRLEAPAKLNLCLFLGSRRDDGLHRLVSVFEPIDLIDTLEVEAPGIASGRPDPAGADGGDEVIFRLEPPASRVGGELASELGRSGTVHAALEEARASGWSVPPVTVTVTKRIPVGAGLGGGSADAAAMLRWLASGVPYGSRLREVAMKVGADVPSQLDPGFSLVLGAGEQVTPLPVPAPHAFVLLPGEGALSTGEVFAEADRLGLGRSDGELDSLERRLREVPLEAPRGERYPPLPAELMGNDLLEAALSLRPGLQEGIELLESIGAERVGMTGSGSTLFGLFAERADAEAAASSVRREDAVACEAREGIGTGGSARQ